MDETRIPAATPELVTVTDICFKPGGKVYFFDPGSFSLRAGDHVIISTARGNEFGYVNAANHMVPRTELVAELRPVVRRATETDEQIAASNRELEKDAFSVCQKKIAALGLEMQLVSAEVAFDGSKIIFFFTADGRVDFRELVKALASVYRTRIELRQIGVRDKAKMVGGLGICGRPFCCGEFLDDFQPVSIKMAKTQNLSLNPTKISGTCGRLMCCLKYEQEAYEALLATAPKNESFVDTPEGRGTITDVQLLQERVKVRMEKAPDEVRSFQNDEICVLRSGKARKTDPPIPDDLAPISGGQLKPRRKLAETISEESFPEVLLRGETPQEPEDQEPAEQKKSNRRRRRGGHKPEGGEAREAKPAEKKQEPAKNPENPNKPQEKKPRPPKPLKAPAEGATAPREARAEDGMGADAPHRRRHRGGRGHRPRNGGAKPEQGE